MPSAQARKKMRKQMKSDFSLVRDTLRKNREKKAEMRRLRRLEEP